MFDIRFRVAPGVARANRQIGGLASVTCPRYGGSMTSKAYPGQGHYRSKGRGENPSTVRVVDLSVAVDMDERTYMDRGYPPPLEDLPWKKKGR